MRVFVVARDASLLVALSLMSDRWEVVTAPEAPTERWLEPGFAVGVVDLKSTAKGLEVVHGLREAAGRTLPCLVVGDEAVPLADAVEVICRPFSVASLTAAIERVVDSVATPVVATGSGHGHDDSGLGSDLAEWLFLGAPGKRGHRPNPLPDPLRAEVAREKSGLVSREPPPGPPPPSSPPLFRREGRPDWKEDAEALDAGSLQRKARKGWRAGKESGTGRHAAGAPAPEHEQSVPSATAAPLAIAAPGPAIATPAPEAPPPAEPNDEEAKLETIHRGEVPTDESAPMAAKPAGQRKGFFRRAASTVVADGRGQQRRRVEAAVAGAANLASLLGDVRATDTAAVAHAFLEEVVDRFSPQAAALYVSEDATGFRVAASYGLSATESHLVVPADHRLFAEITATLSGILISPVAMAQGLVAGIGGAWTESLIVVPVAANGLCHGISTVGSNDYSDTDLENLIALARESAPLLALGAALGRLRLEFVASETGNLPSPEFRVPSRRNSRQTTAKASGARPTRGPNA